MVDPQRPRRVWSAAARGLGWFPTGPAAESAVRGALANLTGRAWAQDPLVRTDALRRLHGCAEAVRGGRQVPPYLDALADALDAVGLGSDAARLSWVAAMDSVRHGRHEPHRWERLARLCEAAPGRLPPEAYLSVDGARPHVGAALLAAARTLRDRETAESGQLALALVRAGGHGTHWDTTWRTELDALRAHGDSDTAMGALLVDPDGRG
jgi:hypothetical protein